MKKPLTFRLLCAITFFLLNLLACGSLPVLAPALPPSPTPTPAGIQPLNAASPDDTLTAQALTAEAQPTDTEPATPTPTATTVSLQEQTATAARATELATTSFNKPCLQVNFSFKGPIVCKFSATFIQEFHATYYTVTAYDPLANDGAGGSIDLTYAWSNTNPCGKFQAANTYQINWLHPDSTLPGACPNEAVHPGIISVVITSPGGSVKCSYPNGSATGNAAQCVNQ